MTFKSLDSFIKINFNNTCISRRNFLPKHRLSNLLTSNFRFCSNKNQNNEPDSSRISKIKKLLDSSSPLRLSKELEMNNDLWMTAPYPEGTVFRETEPEKVIEDEDSKHSPSRFVIMFPGQGNQFVGMAKNLTKYPVALDLFESANEILNYNLLKVCLEGPEEVLSDTKYCQPATFVCSLALLEKLKVERPWVISNCWATCGYSLGELTALVFAGCLNFEKGLKLVKVRSRAMSLSCQKTPGGMLTIFTGPRTTLGKAFSDAIDHCKSKGIENPQCVVASYLFPNCKVIAGNIEALDFIQNNANNYFIRRHSRLPVSGAFHTLLMKDAAKSFSEELIHLKLNKPLIQIFSSATGKAYKDENHVLKYLAKQIYLPVRWEQTVQNILKRDSMNSSSCIYECGPGNSLITTVKKINAKFANNCYAVPL